MDYDYGHWELNVSKFNPKYYFGFVYMILNGNTNKRYIGQKQFQSLITRPPLKGFKRKRKTYKTSNWQSYKGSNNTLLQNIENNDKNISYQLLSLQDSKWDLNYAELETIIKYDAIRSNGFYNEYIGRIGKCPNSSKFD